MRRLALLGVCFALSVFTQRAKAQATYTLKPTPKTVAWGYYDAKATPVLHIKSGDTVDIQTLITNSPKRLEEAGVPPDQVEQSLRDITDQVKDKGPGGHILTGPIYVEDAQPGDVLTLVLTPQTYSVLGATGQNVQITFNAEQITLAEAIVKAEELQDLRSDPAGVFLFRFEPPAVVTALNAPNWAQGPTEVRPSSIASI